MPRGQEDRKIELGMERGTPREGRWPLGCQSLGRDVGTLQEGDGKETLRLHALPTFSSYAKPAMG